MSFKFDLGDEVKDVLTGYKGIVRCRCDYMTGCNRYGIAGKVKKNEMPPDWVHVDETCLVLITSKKVSLPEQKGYVKTGGANSKDQIPPMR